MKTCNRLLALFLVFGLLVTGAPTAFAAVSDTGFVDVAADAWYAEAVVYCRAGGIMSGTGETEFAPNATMNRAMLATVLWRMDGSEAAAGAGAFEDVAAGTWYTEAVHWAARAQIISGYSNTVFGAGDPVTREQIATMLYRYEQHQNGNASVTGAPPFSDTVNIADWAADAVLWAAEQGIITGRPGNLFDPKAEATRAEVAVMLHRYLTVGEETAAQPVPEPEPTEPDNNGIVVGEDGMIAVDISVGDMVFVAKFHDSASARAIIEQMPFTLNMDDYAGQEKVVGLPIELPSASTERPATIHTGELYLWSGNQLVLFYTTFSNSYNYVPIGHIEDTAGLTEALGSGSVTVVFSLPSA